MSKNAPTKTPKPTAPPSKAAAVFDKLKEQARGPGVVIEGDAREFVERVLAHNDTQPHGLRISRTKAAETLKEFDLAISGQTLERWVKASLGRSSWGRK